MVKDASRVKLINEMGAVRFALEVDGGNPSDDTRNAAIKQKCAYEYAIKGNGKY